MRLRLPLYGKILTWFFLNLVIVSAVVAALFTAQFHFNLDWVFSTAGTSERLEAVRNLILGELEASRPDEWEQVLQRYSEAYHVHFALFDEEGRALVGGIPELPAEVQKRIIERPPPFGFPSFTRRATPPRVAPTPEVSKPATATDGPRPIGANGTDRTNRPYATPAATTSPNPPTTNPATPTPIATPRTIAPSPSLQSSTTPAPPATPRRSRLPLRALMRTESPAQYWLLASGRLESPLLGEPMRIVLVARSQTISAGGLILDPWPWLYLGLGIVLFSLVFWWPLIRSITRTIRRMMQTTRQIADGRFDVRVNLRRRDELGSLSDSIDQMAVRLDGLVTGQKRFLGDIAHELCSPLARLQMALGILEQKASAEQVPFVQIASEKAQQISALVGELLSFSKAAFGASAVKLQPVPLRAVLEEAIHREKPEGDPTPAIEIQNIPEDLQVTGDPDLLLRAFSNLIRNALQHAGPTSGPITIRTASPAEAVARDPAFQKEMPPDGVGGTTIIVADQGPGVPPDELSKIFDAFYRLDTSRTRDTGGTGLGLAIVKTCIDSCYGSVSARNGQPTGLEVRVTLHAFYETKSKNVA